MIGMPISDDGTELKKMAQQLQNFGAQIQNLGMQISFLNQNYGVQMQTLGLNISNIAMEIFNIGTKISNINQIQYSNISNLNINQMLMNNIMNNNQSIGMTNNNGYDINLNKNEPKLGVFFYDSISGKRTSIIVSIDKTLEELFNLYADKDGIDIDKYKFLYNGKTLNKKDDTRIKDFGLVHGSNISVIKLQLLGGQ